jgi:hypothetical protein
MLHAGAPAPLDKGKPAARRGRKAYGPLLCRREAAGLPNGGGVLPKSP